jgi:hypothetical protein
VRFKDGIATEEWKQVGISADGFWGMVAGAAPLKSTLWVWLGRAAVAIPALEFTRQVELERFIPAWWVWGNPPTIISGKLAGRGVKLLCLENWFDPKEISSSVTGPPTAQVVSLVSKILRFTHKEDLGCLRSTIGSQSLQAFRHLALPGKIGIHTNTLALKLERECALAMPLRVLRQGKIAGPVYCVDVNAMYPHLMGNYPFPRKLLWSAVDLEPFELKEAGANALLIARVSGHDASGEYAVQRNGKIVWTNELVNDTICGPDLDRALWNGSISKVHAAAAYEGAGVFVKWSEWALALRKRYSTAENAALRPLAKHLTNALWGTFAGHKGRWKRTKLEPPEKLAYGYWHYKLDDETTVRCRTIARITERWEEDEEPQHSFPALSAFVAAYARYYMAGICAIVGWPNIYYLCADGLHVTKEGYKRLGKSRLISQCVPGKLKLVGIHKETFYHAANVYCKDSVWTVSGRPVGAEQTGPGTWQFDCVQSLAHAVMRPSCGAVTVLKRVVALT